MKTKCLNKFKKNNIAVRGETVKVKICRHLNSSFIISSRVNMKSLIYFNNRCPRQNYSLLKKLFCSKVKEIDKTREKWNTVVGLEIHAQISSKSKLFSGSSTEFGNSANSCVSFFDSAVPGTLPVLNRKCVEAGVLTALALSCKINEISLFDRKHYFYADLPAGYQITQQRQPLAVDGEIKFHVFTPGIHKEPYLKSSKLKQIQLEQDSGKTLNDEETKKSLIDLNRAGVPLMEFVFEPDLSDGEEAAALVKELMLILERVDSCSCKMAEGAIRVDANVSINKPNEPLGVRTELKNIGSVRAVASAISYEIKRQIEIREIGGEIINETRAWDDLIKKTVPMRYKEDKQDYRFMPEPNLPPLHIHLNSSLENKFNLVDAVFLKTRIPEMPQETRDKLISQYGVHKALVIVLVNEPVLLQLFLYAAESNSKRSPQTIAKLIVYQLLTFIYKNNLSLEFGLTVKDYFCEIVDLLESGKINVMIVEKVLLEISKNSEKSPQQIVEQNDWVQIVDEEKLRQIIQKNVLDRYPDLVTKYKKGKIKLYKYFMRQIVETTNQKANMKLVDKLMKEMLK